MATVQYTYHSWNELQSLGETIAQHVIAKLQQEKATDQAGDRMLDDYELQLGTPGPSIIDDPPAGWDDYSKATLPSDTDFEYAMTSGLPKLFTSFSIPDPASGLAAIQTLYTVAMTLIPDLQVTIEGGTPSYPTYNAAPSGLTPPETMIANINSHVSGWRGEAATAFTDYFNAFGTSVEKQHGLTLSLAVLLAAEVRLRQAMLTDVWEVGQQTLKAIDAISSATCHPTANNVGCVLTVVGIVADVGLVAVTEGVSLAVTATVGGILLNGIAGALTNSYSANTTPNLPLGGYYTSNVLDNMRARLTEIYNSWVGQEAEIVSAINNLSGKLDTAMIPGAGSILLPMPGMKRAATDGKKYLESVAGFFDPLA
jgi:hypothetical protein